MVRGLCQLKTKCAERIDLDRYRAGYLARKDHKRYQDKAVGRVNLALADTPMSLLQGDVHYADIAVAEGAEPVRVRLIAWLDMSSLFLWVTPVLLSKGKGIVQADVAESLAHVTMGDHGGIPHQCSLAQRRVSLDRPSAVLRFPGETFRPGRFWACPPPMKPRSSRPWKNIYLGLWPAMADRPDPRALAQDALAQLDAAGRH